MKKPYYNSQQRLLIKLETSQGLLIKLELHWLKLCSIVMYVLSGRDNKTKNESKI